MPDKRIEVSERGQAIMAEIEALQLELGSLPPEPIAFVRLAREAQIEPQFPGEWHQEGGIWYLRGSRGSGKTWAGSGNLAKGITEDQPLLDPDGQTIPSEYGVIAPTIADCRDVCFEGPSGLIRALGGEASRGTLIKKGPHIQGWNRSMTQLYLTNGGTVFGASAEDGALRVQGKNLRRAWGDEIGLWERWETAYDESIKYALRMSPAKLILTGTPKMNQKSRVLVKRILEDPLVAKSFLPIEENISNLSEARVKELLKLRGTRLGRQEVGGELVEDIEGAYFFQSQIDDDRIFPSGYYRPKRNLVQWLVELIGTELVRVVVAIDPAVTSSEDSDETGIIVAALGANGHAYLIEDLSGRYSPDEWARIAIDAYKRWQADVIIGEVNNGGDMVGHTIHTVDADAPYRAIRATRGKIIRAEPISAAYAQHRCHHIGPPEQWEAMESQLTSCVPGLEQEHDDRLDANVYALWELGLAGGGMTWEEAYSLEPATSVTKQVQVNAEESSDEEPDEDYDPWAATYAVGGR